MKSLETLKTIVVGAALASTLIAATALAEEHGSGNGGNAVVCFDSPGIAPRILERPVSERIIPDSALAHIESIEALDLVRAKLRPGGLDGEGEVPELVDSPPSEKTSAFIEKLAKRFEKGLPILGDRLRSGAHSLSGRIHYARSPKDSPAVGEGVAQVYDVGILPFKLDRRRCVLSTVMNQTGFGDTLHLEVDDRLYHHGKHSEFSRKTFMVHEDVYIWGRERGQRDSEGVQLLVGAMIRKSVRRSELLEILRRYDFLASTAPEKIYAEITVLPTALAAIDSALEATYDLRDALSKELVPPKPRKLLSEYSETDIEAVHACETNQRVKKKFAEDCAERVRAYYEDKRATEAYEQGIAAFHRRYANEREDVIAKAFDPNLSGKLLSILNAIANGRCYDDERKFDTYMKVIMAFTAPDVKHIMSLTNSNIKDRWTYLKTWLPLCDDFELPQY